MKVIFHKLFPYAPYLNEYIGFEKEVGDTDEEALFAIEDLRKLAERAHKDKYPHLYNGDEQVPHNQPPQPSSEETRINALIQDINACTAISEKNNLGVEVGLLGYEKMVSGDAALKAAYDLKLLQLKEK